MKLRLPTIFALCLALTPAVFGKFVYTTNANSTITIIAAPDATGTLTIPATITGLSVTGIEDYAFAGTPITNASLPETVTSIGVAAFAGCSNLTAINVAALNPVYADTNGVLFDTKQPALIAYPSANKSAAYSIPEGITSIAPFAFYSCLGLTSVSAPTTLTSIGSQAFFFCTNTTNFTFAGNAPIVGADAFQIDLQATAYYYPATSGWGATLANLPAVMLNPPMQSGALQVTLLPVAAAKSGATWQVDGGVPQPSGAVVLGLTVGGNHVLSFNDGKDWAAPANQTISITNGATSTASGTYSSLGSLQVTLTPPAVSAAATWEVDGGAPQPGGAIIDALPAGPHTVTFDALDGWTAPPAQTVTVHALATSHAQAAYTFTARGVYNGLFSDTNGVTEETAGAVRNFTVTPKGAFSGRLFIAGASYSLAGAFDASLQASNYLARSARLGGPLTVQLFAEWSNSPPAITGVVSGSNWTANLTNYLTAATPGHAAYTFLLANDNPPGYGYLLAAKNGAALAVSGSLADGSPISQSLAVSSNNLVPFYASLYDNTGLAFGWLNLSNPSLSEAVRWIKKPSRSALYPAGFTNALAAQGSPWVAPAPGSAALTLTNGALVVSGANLPSFLGYTVSLNNKNSLVKLSGSATNSLIGSVNRTTGLLTVTFGNGAGKATTIAKGAVLQDTSTAGGFFLGKTNNGVFSLQP